MSLVFCFTKENIVFWPRVYQDAAADLSVCDGESPEFILVKYIVLHDSHET